MEAFIPLFIILFIGLAIYSSVMAKKRAEERRQHLAAFGAEYGLRFSPEPCGGMEDELPGFGLFQSGSNRYAQNFLTGRWQEHGLTVFDYHYQVTSGSGKNRRTTHYYYTVLLLQPDFPLRPLQIRPEGLWDRLTSMFGWDDIDFESAEFSRRFHVSAPDRRWAYDVITPRTMEFLLAESENWALQMDDTQLMVPLRGWCGSARILEGLAVGTGLLERIPRFAREEPGA
jgi:hypothetical protein